MENIDIAHRLRNIEGHIRGIERMVEEGAYCIDVIRQIQAVQSSLSKISTKILENHLYSCTTTAIRGENIDEREKVLNEIVDIFQTANDL